MKKKALEQEDSNIMTLRNGSNLIISDYVKKHLLNINNHLHRNYINMGNIQEDNLFLEAEQADENNLKVVMEAEGDNAGDTGRGNETQPKADAQPKQEEAPKEDAGRDNQDQGGDNTEGGDNAGDDLFGQAEGEEGAGGEGGTEGEESEIKDGLPTDDQYYVVLLKDINRKLIKLNEVSLKLLKKTDEDEAKIINKIDSLTYVFNRFVEKYTEYDDAKSTVLELRDITDTIIKFVDIYLKRKDGNKYRHHLSIGISSDTRLKFLDKYMKQQVKESVR